jgi:hypothetical protein
MPDYYYIPGTNIINPEIQNLLDSLEQFEEEVPTVEIIDVPDLSGNIFSVDVVDELEKMPVFREYFDEGTYGYCFIGKGTYFINHVFLELKSPNLAITRGPAFLGDEGTGYFTTHSGFPLLSIDLPYLHITPAFLGDEGTGYSVQHTNLAYLPNVLDMALERGKIDSIIYEPAFIGEGSYDINIKYPFISFEDIFYSSQFNDYVAFVGEGGYTTKHNIDLTGKVIETIFLRYDYSNTLQVFMNTTIMNSKIGVIKDEYNTLISSSYDKNNRLYSTDIVNITANDVFFDISANHIKHLGPLHSFYSDFIEDVNTFFGLGGFNDNLFSQNFKPPTDLSSNIIDYNKAFVSTLLSQLNGNIRITDISSIIDFCVITNPFKNRNRLYNNKEGFLEGDKFFIKKGVTVTFNLDIINNIPSINIDIDISGNQSINEKIYNYDICYNRPFNISKSITSDLLIILKDDI